MSLPQYTPDNPPGYVFVSNSGSFDFIDRVVNTETRVREHIAAGFAEIPLTAFITLVRPKPGIAFATFVEEAYAPIITAWAAGVKELVDAVNRLPKGFA